MMKFPIEDAAKLAEASYSAQRITSPKVVHSCGHQDVQAHLLEGDILLLPGSNSVRDYLRYNLRPLRLGQQQFRMSDDKTEKGHSGTTWHQGFLAYSSVVFEWLKTLNIRPKYVIGHSLGAAATQILSKSYGAPGIGFAAPRPKFAKGPVKHHEKCLLINRVDDVVPKLPGAFNHMGRVRELAPTQQRPFPAHSMKHYREIVEVGQDKALLPKHWAGGV
ncbi:hypothetical protein [Cognatiyoonia sp. IB215182]|uniref:hypothetical protein n=1 Tax=Cognatiyoonia sp. IB215182 TaxID=3097353 RepID=UPI002A1211F6|nr:hypothetical protein [Cognatiyoonia sp. IB215182]MDX8351706.1 hypothetical protein [Cognatiyoonia sp. IB215182]